MGIGELIQRGRQIEISRTTGIVIASIVVLLILGIGYLANARSTPSQAEIQQTNAETTDRFAQWNKARDEAAKKQRSAQQRPPYGNAPRPAGR